MFSAPANAEEALAEFRRQRAAGPAPRSRGGDAQVDSLMAAMSARVAELEALRRRGGLQSQLAREDAARAAPAVLAVDREAGGAPVAGATRGAPPSRRRASPVAPARAEPSARAAPPADADAAAGVPLSFRGPADVPAVIDMLRGLSVLAADAAAEAGHAPPLPAGVRALGRGGGGAAAPPPRDGGLATVPVTFYADGFMLYAGPPRPYDCAEARRFLDAALRGRLPFELKARHADGRVRFDVRDQRALSLGARARARPGGARGAATLGAADAPLDAARFAARLPAVVVTASGRLVDVRADVLRALGAAPAPARAGARAAAGGPSGEPPARDAVRLRLMLPAGAAQRAVVVALSADAPLSAARAALAAVVPAVREGGAYALHRAFPAATFDGDSAATLAALELAPSATLHVRLLNAASS